MKFTVKSARLRDALTGVSAFAGKDDMLPVLKAVHLRLEAGRLYIETTDRFTLAIADFDVDTPDTEDHLKALIPLDLVASAIKAIGKGRACTERDEVNVSVEGADVTIADGLGRWSLSGKTVEGEFPRLEKLTEREPAAIERVGVNPTFMARLTKVPVERNTGWDLVFTGDSKPILAVPMEASEDVTWRVLIMPRRHLTS